MSCAPRRPGLPSGVGLLNRLSCTNDRPSTLSRSIVLIVAVGEQAAPSAPRSVTVEKSVEKTIPAATQEPKPPDTTLESRPPDKPPGKPPEKDKPPDMSTATATASP